MAIALIAPEDKPALNVLQRYLSGRRAESGTSAGKPPRRGGNRGPVAQPSRADSSGRPQHRHRGRRRGRSAQRAEPARRAG
jgi:hypothetical protein